jgi:hypothetical protein
MSRREDRERRMAQWLEHLRSWQASGEALCAYARSRGIAPASLYYWRKVLRREGCWPREPGELDRAQRPALGSDSARSPMRFARVTFEDAHRNSSITVRLTLANGRRAEIELEDTQHLSELLSMLESAA